MERSCLKCQKLFQSRHKFNKLCPHCANENSTANFSRRALSTPLSPRQGSASRGVREENTKRQ